MILAIAGWAHTSLEIQASVQARIQEILDDDLKEFQVPGGTVVVLKSGKQIASCASGIRKYGSPEPILVNDPMHIGSITKSFTATLIGHAIFQNKLKPTDTLAQHFPEFDQKIPANSITIEQLIHHTSGIKKRADRIQNHEVKPKSFRDETVASILRSELETKPGEIQRYENDNYIALGALLERIYGESWEDLLRKYIFDPLNLKTAGFGPTGANDKSSVFQHLKIEDKWLPIIDDNPKFFGPAGTIHMSMPDLAKWTQLHLDGANGKSTLSALPTSTEFWRTLHKPGPIGNYAYGWVPGRQHEDIMGFGHSGSNTLAVATAICYPKEQIVIAIAYNAAPDLSIADQTTRKIYSFLTKSDQNQYP